MRNDKDMWIQQLQIELYMLEPVNFDMSHEIITEYIDQFIRSKERVPVKNAIIPFTIGTSSGLIKIVNKVPSRAHRLPPLVKNHAYLDIIVKKSLAQGEYTKWQYKPISADPIWVDKQQLVNAKLLKAYLTNNDVIKESSLVLLEGKPGTGKSMVVDHVLSELATDFTIIRPASLSRCYIGETANAITEVFSDALNLKPAIIVFEECESIMMSRWSGEGDSSASKHHIEETISALLQGMDRISREDNIFIIATTNMDVNNAGIIDPAVKSRVGLHLAFKEPSDESMKNVISQLCERQGVSLKAVEAALSEMIGTKRSSYRDIHNAISRVKLMESAGLDMPAQEKVNKEQLVYFA